MTKDKSLYRFFLDHKSALLKKKYHNDEVQRAIEIIEIPKLKDTETWQTKVNLGELRGAPRCGTFPNYLKDHRTLRTTGGRSGGQTVNR